MVFTANKYMKALIDIGVKALYLEITLTLSVLNNSVDRKRTEAWTSPTSSAAG